jgi:hypothetical protein
VPARVAKTAKRTAERPEAATRLQGWAAIARFLGQPTAAAQRWAKEGMPIAREGRHVTADPAALSAWLGRESGVHRAVHIAPGKEDLADDLKQALADLKQRRRNPHRVK